jgi:hypothetical protein
MSLNISYSNAELDRKKGYKIQKAKIEYLRVSKAYQGVPKEKEMRVFCIQKELKSYSVHERTNE